MASSSSSFPSKPLHNFDLPSLKWNKEPKPTNRRRSAKSPTRPSRIGADSAHHSPVKVKPDLHRKNHSKIHNIKKNHSFDGFEKKPSSKIVLKLPCKAKKDENEETRNEKHVKVEVNDDKVDDIDGIMDDDAKTWNLRPRRPLVRKCAKSVDVNAKSNVSEKGKNQVVSGGNEGRGEGEKEKEKPKVALNVSLTKEEIEEDMFAFTGSKTTRRPKKRKWNVQKKLDYLFPGLGLVSVTPDMYKVSDNSTKG